MFVIIIMLPLSTQWYPRWVFIQPESLLKAGTCWQGTTPHSRNALSDLVLPSVLLTLWIFRLPHFQRDASLWTNLGAFLGESFSTRPFKPTTYQPNLWLHSWWGWFWLSYTSEQQKKESVEPRFQLHLHRACGFKGLNTGSAASLPKPLTGACANLGFAALSL